VTKNKTWLGTSRSEDLAGPGRRRFLKAAAGSAVLPVAGLADAQGTTPAYVPPSFDPIPDFTFQSGVAGTFDVAPYFREGSVRPASLWSTPASANGVTFNAALKRFEFDGRILPSGSTASVGMFTVSADDGYVPAAGGGLSCVPTTGTTPTLVVREPSGTAGMAFRKGDFPQGSDVVADIPGFQAQVKNRWPDGSAKIAVVSWNESSVSYANPRVLTMSRGKTSAGTTLTLADLRRANPDAEVSLGKYGVVSLRTLLPSPPFRQWLAGAQCSEWHWRAPVGGDPTLVVWYYVRLYASGAIWIRAIVETGYTKVTPQTSKTYRAVITIKGSIAYDSALEALRTAPAKPGDDLVHWSRTRWTKEFWYDARPLRAPAHNGGYLISTRLFPNYTYRQQSASAYTYDRKQYVSSAWFDGAQGQRSNPVVTVAPLDFANQRPDMRPGGYSPTIGIVPLWDVLYLLSAREDMYFCSIANACAGGTFIAWRDERTSLPVKWSDRPNLWMQGGDGNSIAPVTDPAGSGLVYDVAHSPSFSYGAYLFTGDYYHIETMQFAATLNWAGRSYNDREGALGLYWVWIQARAFAWMFRTLAQTLCITPDGDPLAVDYRASLNANVQRHLDVSVDGTHATWGRAKNQLGAICFNTASGNGPPYGTGQYYYEAPWQQHFIGAALAHAHDLELVTGAQAGQIDRLTKFSLGHAVGMLGDDRAWPYTLAGAYGVPYLKNPQSGAVSTYPPPTASWWAPDWATAYAWHREYKPAIPNQIPLAARAALYDTSRTGGSDPGIENGYVDGPSFALSMWANIMPAISAAVDKGVAGAAQAWARLGNASNWQTNAAHFNDRPLWGVTPR
jgi:hypothetical protein